MTPMREKATTIAQLRLVLEQYRRHPKPKSAGVVKSLSERGDESELFGDGG